MVSGILVSLSFLPGCVLFDMFKKNNQPIITESKSSGESSMPMAGEVLVTMQGVPVITTATVAEEKEKCLNANPQIRQALQFMDAQAQERFENDILDGLILQKIVNKNIDEKGITQTAKYKSELKALYEAMENVLNGKYFNEMIKVDVSDAQVNDFYQEYKDQLRGIMTSAGGVATTGISFDNGAAARAFASRAKTMPGGFKKVAQDDNLNAQIKDFKVVNAQSTGIDELLRDKIMGIKTVPSIEVFEVDGKFWVVNATSKEEPKYIPFEQIKDTLRQKLEQDKRVELVQKEIDKLRNQYDVKVNEDYMKRGKQQQEEQVSEQRGGMVDAGDKQASSEKRLA